jgi:hypothetical protein
MWFGVTDSILGAWNTNFRAMLEGTESFSTAMKKTFGELVFKLIESLEALIAKLLVVYALEAATGETVGTGGSLLTRAFSLFKFDKGAWNTSNPSIPFPSYDAGSLSTQGGLAMFHPGEMVIPAGPAAAIREGGGLGGGNNVSIHISALDAGSFAGALRGGLGDAITRHVSRALQQNPSMRPGYTT